MRKKHYRFTRADAAAGGRVAGAKTLAEGTGIHGQTPEQRRDASVKGGLTQGPIQGKKNAEPGGQLDETRALPQSVKARLEWATSAENRNNARQMGRLQGPTVDFSKIKTAASLSLGGVNSTGRHVRWHVNRRIFNLACPFCLEAIARKENWGIPVEDPQ
jgi:hypothetical protein